MNFFDKEVLSKLHKEFHDGADKGELKNWEEWIERAVALARQEMMEKIWAMITEIDRRDLSYVDKQQIFILEKLRSFLQEAGENSNIAIIQKSITK